MCTGHWEYPSSADPSQHPCSEIDLLPSQDLLSPSSSSSSPQSDSSSTADWRDSANLDSLLDMITSQRHTEQSSSTEKPSSSTGQGHTGQRKPEQGSATATGAVSTAAESIEDGTSAAVAEAGIKTADIQGPQTQQPETSSLADESDRGANISTRSRSAPAEAASSADGPAERDAFLVHGSAEDDEDSSGLHPSAAPSHATDSQQSEQAREKTPAAALEGDESLQATCDDKLRPDTSQHGDGQSRTASGSSSAPCQGNTSNEKRPEQAEPTNGYVEVDGKAPKTPIKTAPKKGGLVNVQRPAVKGYCIHRLKFCLCHGCTSCTSQQQHLDDRASIMFPA